jgi:hypothetical protein
MESHPRPGSSAVGSHLSSCQIVFDEQLDGVLPDSFGRGSAASLREVTPHYQGQRYHAEYDSPASGRGPGHRERLIANDPEAEVILIIIPVE